MWEKEDESIQEWVQYLFNPKNYHILLAMEENKRLGRKYRELHHSDYIRKGKTIESLKSSNQLHLNLIFRLKMEN